MILQYDPLSFFEQNPSKGGVCEVKTLTVNGLAVAANTLLVSAISGKRIRVIGGNVFSNGAYSVLSFISASGGTIKKMIAVPANTVATPNVPLVPDPYSFFETNTGEGLYATNSAVIVLLSLNYIEVTP